MDGTSAQWLEKAKALLPDAVALRRRIHEHPELGLHLPRTVEAVREALDGLDVKIEHGPSTSGLIVTLQGPQQGRTVLLRGDMDALPMPEDTGLPSPPRKKARCTPAATTATRRCSRWPCACCTRSATASRAR